MRRQLAEVEAIVIGGGWWTLRALAARHGSLPEASASARLRQLRGLGYRVERRAAILPGGHQKRVFEYRVQG